MLFLFVGVVSVLVMLLVCMLVIWFGLSVFGELLCLGGLVLVLVCFVGGGVGVFWLDLVLQ